MFKALRELTNIYDDCRQNPSRNPSQCSSREGLDSRLESPSLLRKVIGGQHSAGLDLESPPPPPPPHLTIPQTLSITARSSPTSAFKKTETRHPAKSTSPWTQDQTTVWTFPMEDPIHPRANTSSKIWFYQKLLKTRKSENCVSISAQFFTIWLLYFWAIFCITNLVRGHP